MNEELFPEEFDPFRQEGEEYESLLGPEDVEPDTTIDVCDTEEYCEDPPVNDVESRGLKKVCVNCGSFMDTIEATTSEIYDNSQMDDMDVRTWAKCPLCRTVIVIA